MASDSKPRAMAPVETLVPEAPGPLPSLPSDLEAFHGLEP